MERIFGQDINVTTNAVEGLFGRFCANAKISGLASGPMAKSLQSFCGGKDVLLRLEPFYNLLREIKVWQDAHPRRPQADGSADSITLMFLEGLLPLEYGGVLL